MPGRQVFHPAVADVGHHIDADFAAGGEAAGFLELLGEPGPAIALERHIGAAVELLQLFDELQAVDQERLAGLKSAKPVHKPDRSAALDAEDLFENGPIHDRGVELAQLVQSGGKLFDPFGFPGHETSLPSFMMFCHSCDIVLASRFFL